MSTVYATPMKVPFGAATATAGIGGAPIPGRSNQGGGRMNHEDFTFTIPASGAGSVSGDIVVIAQMDVMAWIHDIVIFNDAMGTVTFSVGKIDPNNSANTDASHYVLTADVSVAGRLWGTANLPEQVGTDPIGDQSTGNTVPGFGQLPIQITVTINGTPTTAAVLKGYVLYTDRT